MTDRSALYRRLLAVWTLCYLLPRWPYAGELYLRPVLREDPVWIAWAMPPSAPVVHGLFVVATVCGAALVVVRRARVAHLGLLMALVGIHLCDTIMPRAYGALALMQWALLWLAPHDAEEAPAGLSEGTRLVMLQLSSVYLWTVPAKLLGGKGWWSGHALVSVFNGEVMGDFMLSSIHVTPAMGFAIAWLTLASELFVGLGLWFARTWKAAAFVMVAMHLTMALSLRVSPLFHILMVIHLPLFWRSPLFKPTVPSPR